MDQISADLRRRTEAWIAGDPDAATRDELTALLERGDVAELGERMNGSLEFGTAGLRGRVEGGSNRMNRAVVIRTTRGLARFLVDRDPDSEQPVVVGRDARLSSAAFQDDTVAVLAAAGIVVRYFPEPVPTPLVAYAARALGARAAVVITASHNPPLDNGYKVYDGNGAQIIPPVDKDIAARIEGVEQACDVPRLSGVYLSEVAHPVPDGIFDRYLEEVAAIRAPEAAASDQQIVYTPLHGVGGRFVVAALNHFGYQNIDAVPEQFPPDGRFPTVDFPNPEEPGALDLAIARATAGGADLIVANDPDTDRLAVAVARRDAWQALTGNQVGVLLGDYLLQHTRVANPLVVNSIVSSPMLARIAAAHGAAFAQTLTGFKWIWNGALDIQAAGGGTFVFGYEEALGYSVGPMVRDKDGISAAVIFCDLAAACRASGESVLDYLARLYRSHGLWVSTQQSIVRPGSEGAARIAAGMERLAAAPPDSVAGITVTAATDYNHGAEERPRYLPATNLVELDLGNQGRVLVRPSGTEPKLKIYADLVGRLDPGADPEDAEQILTERATAVAAALASWLDL
jgi:phosphomannomutase